MSDATAPIDADTASQITHRLRLTPAQRLRYLLDVVAFEERAKKARRMP